MRGQRHTSHPFRYKDSELALRSATKRDGPIRGNPDYLLQNKYANHQNTHNVRRQLPPLELDR